MVGPDLCAQLELSCARWDHHGHKSGVHLTNIKISSTVPRFWCVQNITPTVTLVSSFFFTVLCEVVMLFMLITIAEIKSSASTFSCHFYLKLSNDRAPFHERLIGLSSKGWWMGFPLQSIYPQSLILFVFFQCSFFIIVQQDSSSCKNSSLRARWSSLKLESY